MRTQTLTRSNVSVGYPYLTWRQLKQRYPDQWVLLINADTLPTGYAVKGGQFVANNASQDEIFKQAAQLPKGSKMDVVFTGNRELPENVVLCL